MWNTVPHYKASVDKRMSSTHSILARVHYYLLEVTEGLNCKDKEIRNTTHKPEYYRMWQKK
jgi:hypothetical protein